MFQLQGITHLASLVITTLQNYRISYTMHPHLHTKDNVGESPVVLTYQ
jgi:hypothetical protein